MAGLRQCLSAVNASRCLFAQRSLLENCTKQLAAIQLTSNIHTSNTLEKTFRIQPREPLVWPKYNDVVYPPTKPGEPRRPAEICHLRSNVKYSYKTLWYLAAMIRGLSIDEALKQMTFHVKKGSKIVKEVLEEAQEIAINDYNVEYRSNLWIADSFVGKAITIKGYRKHMGPRFGIIDHRYTHYFVRLREGQPPKHYYPPEKTGWEKMEEYLEEQRNRRIYGSL
ncbi:large ribosomal subunit protein uL22m-like [Lineus longissimus]|uniref:large ribosomal subunit protein uL22m-like n=1 Tax=Lineus longissimus TaxID=88925 RepID=UPI002B4DB380